MAQHDDGFAPVRITGYNGARVATITGELDQPLAACIADISDDRFPKLPQSANADAENAGAVRAAAAMAGPDAPMPFVLAILKQESQCRHYNPNDGFVTIGLDRGDGREPARITSRGYGIGQYTLFHHPPTPAELRELSDPEANILRTRQVLAEKWKGVHGEPERLKEHPALGFARQCRYPASDTQRWMRACRECAAKVRRISVAQGQPYFPGAAHGYQPDSSHPVINYTGVPDRADFLCDWAYAVRRYNGAAMPHTFTKSACC